MQFLTHSKGLINLAFIDLVNIINKNNFVNCGYKMEIGIKFKNTIFWGIIIWEETEHIIQY